MSLASARPFDSDIITKHIHLTRGNSGAAGAAGAAGTKTNGISYHGGAVMTANPTNVYYIYYGNDTWATKPNAQAYLNNLAQYIGGTSWYNIQTTYYNGAKVKVPNAVSFVKDINVTYTKGKSLTDAQVFAVVTDALAAGSLPVDADGVYFVLTASDVTASSGFCTQYCGWHTHGTYNSVDIKYSFVGDAGTQCPGGCISQTATISGDVGADGMASVIAHELVEAVSDPDLNAWYDTRGRENADKCAWTFGTTYLVQNSLAKANVKFNNVDYLIQQNWVNANGGYCAMSY